MSDSMSVVVRLDGLLFLCVGERIGPTVSRLDHQGLIGHTQGETKKSNLGIVTGERGKHHEGVGGFEKRK